MKRFLCSLLSVLFVVGIWFSVPMTASAKNPDFMSFSTYEIEEQINPIYKGLVSESKKLTSTPEVYYSDSEGFDVALCSTDKEKAVQPLRLAMENRESNADLYYTKDDNSVLTEEEMDELFYQFLELAVKETNVATQGDSLRYGYRGAEVKILCQYTADEEYYYRYTYTCTYYTTAEQEAELTTAINEVIEELNFSDSTTEKEKSKAIYDFITQNVTYDHQNLENEEYTLKFTPYAALIKGTAVCQGYAMLYYRLAEEVGLDCRIISGTSQGENHAWNIVKIGSSYYYLDSTWDAGKANYSFYLKGSMEFPDHTNEARFETVEFKEQYPIPNYYAIVGSESDFGYTSTTEGAVITSYTGEATNLILPTKLGGETVVGIGPNVFSRASNSTVETLTIGEGVAWLDETAFDYSETLKEINLPSTLNIKTDEYGPYAAGNGSIGGGSNTAPFSCPNLEKITVAAGNTNIKVDDGVLYSYDGKKLILYPAGKTDETSFTVPDIVEEIAPDAFDEAKVKEVIFTTDSNLKCLHYWAFSCARKLEKITLENTKCEFIGQFALTNTSLKNLTIPKETIFIGSNAFALDCPLTEITVAGGNTFFEVIRNGLYEKATKTLLKYACDETVKEATVEAGTEVIAFAAFNNLNSLEKITLPRGLQKIENSAFSGCENLASLTIPSTVTQIGDTSDDISALIFDSCDKLATLTILNDNCSIANGIFHSQQKYATIYANSGSTAETYAQNNAMDFVVLTDDFVCDTNGCNVEFTIIEGEESYKETYQCTVCKNCAKETIYSNLILNNCDVELEFTEKTYTGLPIKPQILSITCKVYKSETEYEIYNLVEDVDYTKEYINNVNVSIDEGSFIRLKGKGRFNNSTRDLRFVITPVELIAPQNLKVTYSSTTKFRISWDEIPGADGYRIYRKSANGEWERWNSTTETSCGFANAANNEYTYKIVAYHDFNLYDRESVNSSEITVKSYNDLPTPTTVTVKNIDFGKIELQWSEVEGAATYKILEEVNGEYIERYTTNNCTYQISNLEDNKFYVYAVVPCIYSVEHEQYIKCINSKKSGFITTWNNLPATTKVEASLNDNNVIFVMWDEIANAHSYRVYYKKSTDTNFERFVDVRYASFYNFENLDKNCEYIFKVHGMFEDLYSESLVVSTNFKTVTCRTEQGHYHSYSSQVTKQPTCTEAGIKTFTCSCNDSYTETIPAKGHTEVSLNAVAPTCTKTGLTAGKKCSVCGTTTLAQQTVAKVPHKEVTLNAVAATCTTTGLTAGKKCTVCNEFTVPQQVVMVIPHTTSVINAKAPTCVQAGYSGDVYCTVCKNTVNYGNAINATGHKYDGGKITTTATCIVNGVKTFSCTVCKATKTEAIAKTAHTEMTLNAVAPTCTKTGLTAGKKCSVCNVTMVAQQLIAATGHKEVVIPAVAPTYTAVGKTEGKKCSVCNVITVPQKDVAKLVLGVPAVKIANSANGITVTWNAVEGAESYIVYRRTYNPTTKKYSGWTTLNGAYTSTSYTDTKVVLGTQYSYTVRAVNNGVKSNYKASSGLKYNVTPTVKISNATNGVTVSWTTAANADGYRVYRSTYNSKTKKWSSWKNMGTAKATATSWTDKSAQNNTYYKYTVRAVEGKFLSSYKASSQTRFFKVPTVKIANNASGVKVTWSKISGATSYVVYRSEFVNGKWSSWKTLNSKATSTSYTDKTAKSGTQYRYTVRAVNGSYKSAYVSSSTLLYLAQPKVTVANASNGIKVSWTQSEGATGYTVYSSTYNTKTKKWSSWSNRGTAKATATSWTDKSVANNTYYKYTVRAVEGKFLSSYKASTQTRFFKVPTVKIANNASGVKVTWSKISGATSYIVYRSEFVNGKWSSWKTLNSKATSTSYTDKTAKSGTQYRYTVRAVNGSYKSAYVSSSTLLYLAQPKTTVAKASNGIKVSWTQSEGATGYTVYSSTYNTKTKKWSGWTNRGTAKATSKSWTDKKAKKGTTYRYTVKAVNGKSASAYTASSSIKR